MVNAWLCRDAILWMTASGSWKAVETCVFSCWSQLMMLHAWVLNGWRCVNDGEHLANDRVNKLQMMVRKRWMMFNSRRSPNPVVDQSWLVGGWFFPVSRPTLTCLCLKWRIGLTRLLSHIHTQIVHMAHTCISKQNCQTIEVRWLSS